MNKKTVLLLLLVMLALAGCGGPAPAGPGGATQETSAGPTAAPASPTPTAPPSFWDLRWADTGQCNLDQGALSDSQALQDRYNTRGIPLPVEPNLFAEIQQGVYRLRVTLTTPQGETRPVLDLRVVWQREPAAILYSGAWAGGPLPTLYYDNQRRIAMVTPDRQVYYATWHLMPPPELPAPRLALAWDELRDSGYSPLVIYTDNQAIDFVALDCPNGRFPALALQDFPRWLQAFPAAPVQAAQGLPAWAFHMETAVDRLDDTYWRLSLTGDMDRLLPPYIEAIHLAFHTAPEIVQAVSHDTPRPPSDAIIQGLTPFERSMEMDFAYTPLDRALGLTAFHPQQMLLDITAIDHRYPPTADIRREQAAQRLIYAGHTYTLVGPGEGTDGSGTYRLTLQGVYEELNGPTRPQMPVSQEELLALANIPLPEGTEVVKVSRVFPGEGVLIVQGNDPQALLAYWKQIYADQETIPSWGNGWASLSVYADDGLTPFSLSAGTFGPTHLMVSRFEERPTP